MRLRIREGSARWRDVVQFDVRELTTARQAGLVLASLAAGAGTTVELAIVDSMDVAVERCASWTLRWVVPATAQDYEMVP